MLHEEVQEAIQAATEISIASSSAPTIVAHRQMSGLPDTPRLPSNAEIFVLAPNGSMDYDMNDDYQE